MKAVILAAGKGTRLGEITENLPKPMISVRSKPILEHNIELCRKHGIKEIYINLHHLPDIIKDYFGDGSRWDVSITYKEEKAILGTASGVKNFSEELGSTPFFVIYGDNLSDCNLNRVLNEHIRKAARMSIVLIKLDDVSQSGVAELDAEGKILRFIEKPSPGVTRSHWVNAGIYILDSHLLNDIPNEGADFGRDIIPLFLKKDYRIIGLKTDIQLNAFDTPQLLKISKPDLL